MMKCLPASQGPRGYPNIYSKILCTSKYSKIPPRYHRGATKVFPRYPQVPPGTPRYPQVPPSIPRYLQVFPRYPQGIPKVSPSIPRYPQVSPR